jgi:hypothetical protein
MAAPHRPQENQAGVKNLLDRSYYYNAGFPEAGRTWSLNVRYSFLRHLKEADTRS